MICNTGKSLFFSFHEDTYNYSCITSRSKLIYSTVEFGGHVSRYFLTRTSAAKLFSYVANYLQDFATTIPKSQLHRLKQDMEMPPNL